MRTLSFGAIVLVPLLDPGGKNAKTRPAIVLTAGAEIESGADLTLVAITGAENVRSNSPESYVHLPWSRAGHPKTGLTKASVAMCTWLVPRVAQASIVDVRGIVPAKQLEEIALKVKALVDAVRLQDRDDPPADPGRR